MAINRRNRLDHDRKNVYDPDHVSKQEDSMKIQHVVEQAFARRADDLTRLEIEQMSDWALSVQIERARLLLAEAERRGLA
jgi:hypothetical protein